MCYLPVLIQLVKVLGRIIDMTQRLLHLIFVGFFYADCALAQEQVASQGSQGTPSLLEALVQMLPMLAICYLIFYFMVIRPQEAKTKKHKAMMDNLKKGDSVVTSSGILGKIAGIEAEHLLVEVAQNVKIKVISSHISKVES